MIVGIGKHPKKHLDFLREYFKNNPNIIIYPRFFDDKKSLISRNYRGYIRRIIMSRNVVRLAVWPDYMHQIPKALESLNNITWIYPLHEIKEISFVLKLAEHFDIFLAFPNRSDLRDYGLDRFLDLVKEYSFRSWLLGLKPKFVKYVRLFNGTDVTPMSIRGLGFKDFKKPSFLLEYARFIESLVNMS